MKKLIKAFFRRIKWFSYSLFMFCCRIVPIKKEKVIFLNYFGKGYGDNSKYICEFLRQYNGLDLVWAVKNMNEELPTKVRKVRYMSLKYFFEMSTAKVWVDNCRKQPYIIKRKKQYYIQTWHGDIGPKKVEGEAVKDLYASYIKSAKRDSKMANLFVSGNAAFSKRYRTAFWYEGEIANCGYPRRDILGVLPKDKQEKIKEKLNINCNSRVVLYAPTFRSGSLDLSIYTIAWENVINELQKKFGGDWIVLVRLHPNISLYSSKLDFSDNVLDATNYPDMQELLAISDVCISDYSSAIFEFAVTGKPGFIYAKDYQEYRRNRDVLIELDNCFFPFAETESALLDCIKEFNAEKYQEKVYKFLYDEIGYFQDGNASEYIGKIILSQCGIK